MRPLTASAARFVSTLLVVALALSTTPACAQSTNSPAQSPSHTLDALHRAASEADHETYFELFTPNAVFLGTDPLERWTLDQFRTLYLPYMRSGRGWTYAVRDRHIHTPPGSDTTAWFDERLHNDAYGECRGTGVLVRPHADAPWRIAQYNLSFPVPNDLAREVVDKGRDHRAASARVMSFNIRYDNPDDAPNHWDARKDAVVRTVLDHRPDIVAIQEALAHQLEHLERNLPGFARVGVARGDGDAQGEFVPILYDDDRYDLDASGTFWLSPDPEVPGSTGFGNTIPRICSWVTLRDTLTDPPGAITVYNIHLDHRSEASRAASIALLADRITAADHRHPVVIAGDFNDAPDAPYYGPLNAIGLAAVPFDEDSQELGTYHAFEGPGAAVGRAHIDRFYTDRARIDASTTATILTAPPPTMPGAGPVSDHFPVMTNIRVR